MEASEVVVNRLHLVDTALFELLDELDPRLQQQCGTKPQDCRDAEYDNDSCFKTNSQNC